VFEELPHETEACFLPLHPTVPGQYGKGDQFLGVTVPNIRTVVKQNQGMNLDEVEKLLHSRWHEERLLSLLILTYKYEALKRTLRAGDESTETQQKAILDFYLANTAAINNWDLVDASAHKIAGAWILFHPEDIGILHNLTALNTMWKQRIAIISTFALIKAGHSNSKQKFYLYYRVRPQTHEDLKMCTHLPYETVEVLNCQR